MEIKITNEYCNYYRISKDFTIEFEIRTGKNKTETIELTFNKWIIDSDSELDEDIQTEIDDFISEIKL